MGLVMGLSCPKNYKDAEQLFKTMDSIGEAAIAVNPNNNHSGEGMTPQGDIYKRFMTSYVTPTLERHFYSETVRYAFTEICYTERFQFGNSTIKSQICKKTESEDNIITGLIHYLGVSDGCTTYDMSDGFTSSSMSNCRGFGTMKL